MSAIVVMGSGMGAGACAVVCAMSSPRNAKTRQQLSASRVMAYVATRSMRLVGFMCQVAVCMRPRRRSSVSPQTSPHRRQLTLMPPYLSW